MTASDATWPAKTSQTGQNEADTGHNTALSIWHLRQRSHPPSAKVAAVAGRMRRAR